MDKLKCISKFKVFIVVVAVLKLILMGLYSSDYQDKLFIPFVLDFVSNGGNVYERFYQNGITNAFPYPIMMLLIQSIPGMLIEAFNIGNTFLINFIFKIPSFILDLVCLYFLTSIFGEKRRYVAVFYYASPIIIYAVYMHGQLDLIPTVIMLICICVLASKWKYRLIIGIIFTIIALLCKFHILAVIPVVVFYLFNREGLKKSIIYVVGIVAGVILGVLPVLSEGFTNCVLLNSEQGVLTEVVFNFATVQMYIPIAAVLIVYLLTFKLSFINQELFINLCSMVFAIFLALCPPMPGWYVWIVPYIAIFLRKLIRRNIKIS